jgi:hypothetical protein
VRAGVTVRCYDWQNPGVGGGQQIFCQGTTTIEATGHLNCDGQVNSVNLQTGGLGTPSGVTGNYLYGSDGGSAVAGGAGNAGSNLLAALGGAGGAGGAGSGALAGGAAGTVTVPANSMFAGLSQLYLPTVFQTGRTPSPSSPFWILFAGGSGGGAGGGFTGGFYGGSGSGGGGVLGLFTKFLANSGTISCNGGIGNRGDWHSVNGGGGGGGGGGILLIVTTTASPSGTITCNGGAGGGVTAGVAGSAGTAGTAIYMVAA